MVDKLIQIIQAVFKCFGIGITSQSYLSQIQNIGDAVRRLDSYDLQNLKLSRPNLSFYEGASITEFLLSMPVQSFSRLLSLINRSNSQLGQDLLVLAYTQFKENGYFVEFGATDGITLSNTSLLESEFGWNGILAEPAEIWHDALLKNRPNSIIEKKCIWSDSNSLLTFNETEDPELSTVHAYTSADQHLRGEKKLYKIKTISLNDLLRQNCAPNYIDYISIDTEGSEFQILSALDFETYSFGVITCEHNNGVNKKRIHKLLTGKGYRQVFENLSKFDGWYVNNLR